MELKIHLVIQFLNHSWNDHKNILIHLGEDLCPILIHLYQGLDAELKCMKSYAE